MQPPRKNIEHFMAPSSLDGDLEELQFKFSEWEAVDGRRKKSVWALLGKAYELGCGIADDKQSKSELAARVYQLPSVKGNNRWNASKRHPFDLLLVLLLGLKHETKATKSQWLRTLKAAEKGKVAATQNDFVGWIKKTGGIDGVLRPRQHATQVRKTISQLGEGLEPDVDFTGKPLKVSKIALNCLSDELPEGFALILVKESDEKNIMSPLATIIDERQISAAIKSVLAKNEKQERENAKQHRQTERLIRTRVRRAAKEPFNKHKRSVSNPSTFDEFLEEFISEFPDHVPHGFEYLFRR